MDIKKLIESGAGVKEILEASNGDFIDKVANLVLRDLPDSFKKNLRNVNVKDIKKFMSTTIDSYSKTGENIGKLFAKGTSPEKAARYYNKYYGEFKNAQGQ